MRNKCRGCGAEIPEGTPFCSKCVSDKKPCYVCGTPKPWLVKILQGRGPFTRYFVECRHCHCCGPARIGKNRAIKAWNEVDRHV